MILKKSAVFLCFSLLIIYKIDAQELVYGYVQDSATSERLVGVNIRFLGGESGVISNTYGFFSLKNTGDSGILMLTYVGYKVTLVKVKKGESLPLIINMPVESYLAKDVTVSGKKDNKIAEEVQMSVVNIPIAQIKMLPRFFGETDIIKAIQLMPGIKGGSEGSTGLYVRGGGPDQNLILLDGAMVYNPSHLFGFFSVFNTDAINNVQMLKGGFPARYGGRLSSVLDITMKEGNMKKFGAEGNLGILASKLTLEGPIVKDKVSFMVSGRRTYLDALLQPIMQSATGNHNLRQGYYFSDINAKVNWNINKKNRLYLSYYDGIDKFYMNNKPYSFLYDGNIIKEESQSHTQWGNQLGAIRLSQILKKNLFLNTQLNFTKYHYDIFQSQSNSETTDTSVFEQFNSSRFTSRIRDINLKSDAELNLNKHYVRFGVAATLHRFVPGRNEIVFRRTGLTSIDTAFGSGIVNSLETSAYIEDDYEITPKLKANFGFHFNLYNYQKTFYPSIQPRIALRQMIRNDLSLKFSYANMRQNIHLLTNNTLGLPNDLWVPATDLVKPMLSNQVALGIAKTLNNMFEFTFETYYKTMDNIIEFKEGASFLNMNQTWESQVAAGKSEAYGFEFLAQKKAGKLTGWIGYTLSWVTRTIPEINFGKKFYYKYDSRHDFSFVLNYKDNEKWDYGLVWVYRTGNAITMPTAEYKAANSSNYWSSGSVYHYDERNNFRFADYHRLDLSATRHYKKKWGIIDLNFSIYNAYSRINPFFYVIGRDYRGNKQITRIGLFPFLPSISVGFKF
jgi:hypothetical protein